MLTSSWKGCPISELSLALRHKTDEAGYQQLVWGGQLITFQFTTGSFQNSAINLDTYILYNCFFCYNFDFQAYIWSGEVRKYHFVLYCASLYPTWSKKRQNRCPNQTYKNQEIGPEAKQALTNSNHKSFLR